MPRLLIGLIRNKEIHIPSNKSWKYSDFFAGFGVIDVMTDKNCEKDVSK
jgi:hypothetical protein